MNGFYKFNDEVYFNQSPIAYVGAGEVESLKAAAIGNSKKKSRLCAHCDVNDSLHEMLIVHNRDAYVRPHKHVDKSESFHIIEGKLKVVLFEEDGRIRSTIDMSSYLEGGNFYYRLSEPIFHTVLILSEVVVFHEVTNGPFRREDMIFPDWAPAEHNFEAVQEYMNILFRESESSKVSSTSAGI